MIDVDFSYESVKRDLDQAAERALVRVRKELGEGHIVFSWLPPGLESLVKARLEEAGWQVGYQSIESGRRIQVIGRKPDAA